MSKVLFVHDGPLYIDENNHYYAYSYDDNLKNRYLQIGEKITFLMRTEFAKGGKYTRLDSTNMEVVSVPNFKNPKFYFQNINKAKKIIKETVLKNDFIIVRLPSSNGMIAIKYAEKFNKPYLVELVGCPWDAYWNHSLKGKIIAPFEYTNTKKVVKNSSHVLYVTNDFLQKRYPTNGKSLGCSDVNITIEENILQKRKQKISETLKNKKIVIGTIGNIDLPYKGQKYVIEALSQLTHENFEFEYQLVGNGDSNSLTKIAAKLNIEEKVKFMGTLEKKEVFNWLDTIDIYIQPSLQEGLPRAVVEALSRGCLVLGSTAGGIYELVNKDFLFKKRDSNAIKEILINITEENLISEAQRSVDVAITYDYELLEKQKITFYRDAFNK